MTHRKCSRTFGAGVAAIAASALVACTPVGQQAAAPRTSASIIPAPEDIEFKDGVFTLGATTPVIASADAANVARYFIDLTRRTRGPALSVAEAGDQAIHFELVKPPLRDERYLLEIQPQGISVRANDTRGLFYGAVSLWQLISAARSADGRWTLPALLINDAPRFGWRGLMLDSARHFQSPQFVKRFIDWMAVHKLNVLHWHLTDDQAWRLEITKYPELTSVGAWRVPAGQAPQEDIDPATGKPRKIGGFYTQDEVRAIVAYAAERRITIVPEIEMPGHASAAVVAYPEVGVSRTMPEAVPSNWGVYTTLYNADESTFQFLEDVLADTIQLFPGDYIHVGGDEALKDEWQKSPKIQERIRELGLKNEDELQRYFIQRAGEFLSAHGRKLIGWDEILNCDEILNGMPAKKASVMVWRNINSAIVATNAGYDTVLSLSPDLYLDRWQSDGDPAPGRSNVITLEQVYKFEPAPESIAAPNRKHILGVQANIWTEYMRSDERVEYMTFPRAAALAEVAWSLPKRIDWADFSARLPAQLARYDALGIRYARTTVWPQPEANKRTSHQLKSCKDNGYLLSLEDDAPIEDKRAVFYVDISNPCWLWRDADLSKPVSIRATVGQIPFNFQIGNKTPPIPLPPPSTKDGELEVRVGGCEGKLVATLPLAPAATHYALTTLPDAQLAAQGGVKDLCFSFTGSKLDPMWVVDTLELVGNGS